MLIRPRPIALLALTLSLSGLASFSGCLYLSDAAHRDGQSLSQIPEAIGDGTKQDLKNYKVVKPEDPENPPKNPVP